MTKQKATTYTAAAPNGEVFKRTTHRIYTHVVIAPRSYEEALMRADRERSQDEKDGRYFLAVAASTVGSPHPCGHGVVRKGDPEEARQRMRCAKTAIEYAAAQRAARVAWVEEQNAAGFYKRYDVLGWCGRADLAQKLARQHSRSIILPVVAS